MSLKCRKLLIVFPDSEGELLIGNLKGKHSRVFLIDNDVSKTSELLEEGLIQAVSLDNEEEFIRDSYIIYFGYKVNIKEWINQYAYLCADNALFMADIPIKEAYILNMSLDDEREFVSVKIKEGDIIPSYLEENSVKAHFVISSLNSLLKKVP